MTLLCTTCNQSPLPILSSWHEEAERWIDTEANTCSDAHLAPQGMRGILEDYIANLEKELKKARQILTVTQARSAPISKLADELLIHVFEELYFISDTYKHDDYRINPAINSISMVCKRWHKIVLSSPIFWTTFALGDSACLQCSPVKTLKIESQIERSEELPLTLKLQGVDLLKSITEKGIGPSFNRITVLDILQPIEHLGEQDIFASCHIPPNITHLIMDVKRRMPGIELVGFGEDIDESVTINIPMDAVMHLTSVQLTVLPSLSRVELPWRQLTALSITLSSPVASVFAMISNLQRVETLSFIVKGSGRAETQDWSSLTLPSLRSLEVYTHGFQDVGSCLLRYTSFPSLSVLQAREYDPYQSFALDLRNPQLWHITELFLSRGSGGWEDRITAFREFKQVKRFHCILDPSPKFGRGVFGDDTETIFSDSDSDNDLLSLLALDSSSIDALFPNLIALEIANAFPSSQSLDILQYMLQNRVSTVDTPIHARKALRSVMVSFTEPRFDYGHPPALTFRPFQYNDEASYVVIAGHFIPGTLEDKFSSHPSCIDSS